MPKPRIRARLREALTPVRLLAIGSIVALACGAAFIVASLLPGGSTPQPAYAAAVSASAEPVDPASTERPQATPRAEPVEPAVPTWAPTDRALDWRTASVRLEAAAVTLSVGERVFAAPAGLRATGSLGPERTSLRVGWFEDAVEQRLVVEVARDGDSWWVARIRTYDGRARGGWIEFEGLADRTRTPVGESWVGDLAVASSGAERKALRRAGAATLDLEALRLSAFGPEGSLVAD
jgi:hypothetical protein